MKLYLKGGTIIEVDLKEQVFIFNETRFSVFDGHKDDRPWSVPSSVESMTIPLSYLERIEL